MPIEVAVNDRVARVTLNAPPRNILTSALQDELRAVFESLRARNDHNAVFLQSAVDEFFSAGADVAEHVGLENCRRMLKSAHALIAEVLRCPVPTVCFVRGHCFGGGLELAFAFDQLVAEEDSSFALPEITLGCYPPAAMVLLPQKLPPMLAAELIQMGRGITAKDFVRAGGGIRLAQVEAQAEPAKSLAELRESAAASYARLSRAALVIATRLLRSGAAERFLAAVGGIEEVYLEQLLQLHDAKEGPEAFLAKRKPQWSHS
jgi:cyclohexa-1,5-dienecarbonyl-CoA hydratase